MNDKRNFAIIGGDLRNLKLADLLLEDGYNVKLFGFEGVEIKHNEIVAETLKDTIENADVVIGPVPCSVDGQTLNCSYFSDKIYISELFRLMNKNQIFISAMIDEKIKHTAEACNVYCEDILKREEMAVLNAIPIVLSKSVQLLKCAS